jgi:hypothetical protein
MHSTPTRDTSRILLLVDPYPRNNPYHLTASERRAVWFPKLSLPVIAAYTPRVRPGVPVSFPIPWEELESVVPADFTVRTAVDLLAGSNPWSELMPEPQALGSELVEEGRAIPVARVQAMHEGKRRARERRA